MLSLCALSETQSLVWACTALIFDDSFFITILWKMLSWTTLLLIYRSTGTRYWLQQVFLLWGPLLPSSEVSPHHSSLRRALWLCKSPVSLKGLFVWFDYFKAREKKKKYSDGFFFWKPPRKVGELWAFLFLLTPSILLPASSLQKELRDHRALLVSQSSFPALQWRKELP